MHGFEIYSKLLAGNASEARRPAYHLHAIDLWSSASACWSYIPLDRMKSIGDVIRLAWNRLAGWTSGDA